MVIDFNNTEETRAFWALPYETRAHLFNTPCGDGYTCPDCKEFYAYHSGAATSGGMHACFVDSALYRQPYDSCCNRNYVGRSYNFNIEYSAVFGSGLAS